MSDLKRQNKQEGILQNKKAFLFIYPIPEYINKEIKSKALTFKKPFMDYLSLRHESLARDLKKSFGEEYEKQCEEEFREFYKEKLNLCINLRYRQNDFSVFYALFDNHLISNVMETQPGDKILRVGKDFNSFNVKTEDDSNYPNPDLLLDQLTEFQTLTLAGFHVIDCVDRFAKRACERKFNVLVDEDLTENFTSLILEEGFRLDVYPSIIYLENYFGSYFEIEKYLNERIGKPWLWQDRDTLMGLPFFDAY